MNSPKLKGLLYKRVDKDTTECNGWAVHAIKLYVVEQLC